MQKNIFIAFCLSLLIMSKIYGQVSSVQRAEAMFIYNFARLIQWPEDYRSGDFIIGVLGASDVYSELKSYTSNKKVGFQNVVVKKLKSVNDIDKCHILFISYGKTNSLSSAKQKTTSYSTLIISEKKGSISQGAAISFIITGSKLQFELKESNATDHGLKISSRLKDMASKVY